MVAPRKTVIGNWKMNGLAGPAQALVQEVARHAAAMKQAPAVVICPPATLLYTVAQWLKDSRIQLGAQDCHTQKEGAHTGDIAAGMLKEAGCSHVIVGHSERRQNHNETDAQVAAKAAVALEAGLVPVICIGETLAQRKAGQAFAVVEAQLQGSLPEAKAAQFLLAYEPVWAIGSGLTAEPADIAAMHAHIHDVMRRLKGETSSVLYGGSVKADNAASIMDLAEVDGVLVGGASLKAKEFCAIMDAAVG